jgi:hypothetical protein
VLILSEFLKFGGVTIFAQEDVAKKLKAYFRALESNCIANKEKTRKRKAIIQEGVKAIPCLINIIKKAEKERKNAVNEKRIEKQIHLVWLANDLLEQIGMSSDDFTKKVIIQALKTFGEREWLNGYDPYHWIVLTHAKLGDLGAIPTLKRILVNP